MANTSIVVKAVLIAGGPAKLSRELGVTSQAISQWMANGRVPAARCIAIERATKGAVSRQELRPDLYPAEFVDAR